MLRFSNRFNGGGNASLKHSARIETSATSAATTSDERGHVGNPIPRIAYRLPQSFYWKPQRPFAESFIFQTHSKTFRFLFLSYYTKRISANPRRLSVFKFSRVSFPKLNSQLEATTALLLKQPQTTEVLSSFKK